MMASTNLLEAEADFVSGFRADRSGNFDALFEENGSGPEFYAERAAERTAGTVFDFHVLDGGELGESFCDGGCGGLAVAAPSGAEFEKDRAAGGVDLFARGTWVEIFVGHCASSKKPCLVAAATGLRSGVMTDL